MDKETRVRPINAARRQRLVELLEEAGGPKRLAEIASTTDTHLTAMSKGRRNVGDDLANKLEAATGKRFGWMDYMPGETMPIPFASLNAFETTLVHAVRKGLSEDELINLISVISDAIDTKRDSVNPDEKISAPRLYFGLERRTNEGGVRVPKGENNWTEGQYVSDPKTRRTDRGNHK